MLPSVSTAQPNPSPALRSRHRAGAGLSLSIGAFWPVHPLEPEEKTEDQDHPQGLGEPGP